MSSSENRNISITHLPPSAYAPLIPSLASLLKQCVEQGYSLNFFAPLPIETACEFWAESLKEVESGEHIVFLARNEANDVIGCVVLAQHFRQNSPHRGDVRKLLVDEKYRGKGVAKRLMATLEAHSKNLGRTTLILDTETRSGAETFYEKIGWVKVGVIPEIAWSTDKSRLVPTTFFYKLLK